MTLKTLKKTIGLNKYSEFQQEVEVMKRKIKRQEQTRQKRFAVLEARIKMGPEDIDKFLKDNPQKEKKEKKE